MFHPDRECTSPWTQKIKGPFWYNGNENLINLTECDNGLYLFDTGAKQAITNYYILNTVYDSKGFYAQK